MSHIDVCGEVLTSSASSVHVSRTAVVALAGPVLVEVHVVSAPALVAVLDAVHDRPPRAAELFAELLSEEQGREAKHGECERHWQEASRRRRKSTYEQTNREILILVVY